MKIPTYEEFCEMNNEWFTDVSPNRGQRIVKSNEPHEELSDVTVKCVINGVRVDIIHKFTKEKS